MGDIYEYFDYTEQYRDLCKAYGAPGVLEDVDGLHFLVPLDVAAREAAVDLTEIEDRFLRRGCSRVGKCRLTLQQVRSTHTHARTQRKRQRLPD